MLLKQGKGAEGVSLLQQLVLQMPYNAKLHNNLGQALLLTGQRNDAFDAFKASFDLDPDDPNTLNNLGILSLEKQLIPQAQSYLERSIRLKPEDNFDAYSALGVLFGRTQDYAAAETVLKKAYEIDPHGRNVEKNLVTTLFWLGKNDEVRPLCENILKRNPDDLAVMNSYAAILVQQRDRLGAIEIYKKMLALDKTQANVWITLAASYEHLGLLEEAKKTLADAKDYCTSWPRARMAARIALREKLPNEELRLYMDELLASMEGIDENEAENAPPFFELGRLYDKLGEPAKAFENFEKANYCQSVDPYIARVSRTSYLDEAHQYAKDFTDEFVKNWSAPVPYSGTPQPIFLVGFPRSGTTLLDQIMHSHPDIEVAEEYPAIGNLLQKMYDEKGARYPAPLPDFTADEIEAYRAAFFETHKNEGASFDRKYFVDKMPLNLTLLGLIYRIFPDAKIILALRHPCDSVLSCFMQSFHINAAMANFMRLDTAAALYDAVFTLWEQYERVLPLSVHKIRYEDVVADFQPTVAALLEFIGVPWDDRVLAYDKTAAARGPINTPSYHQVTQKIYKDAKGRWIRYRDQMEPVLDVLLPWAEKHGYGGK